MTTPIKIVTDSSVQLTPEEVKKNDIHIVPLSVEIEGKNYVDGEDITRQELIDNLRAGKYPKTSQPPLGKFVELYDKLGADGSEVLVITISDVLSGTFNTAQSAAEMSKAKVTVINSKSTDRGLAFQVLGAAADIAAGKTIAEIKQHCADIYKRTRINVLIDNLDCLVKGGRISRFAGAVTKLINLKVIVQLNNKSLDVIVKGRSRKTFLKFCQQVAAAHQNNKILDLSLSHVGVDNEFLDRLKDIILPTESKANYLARLTSPIIMTHTGLNAVGIITLSEKPEPQEA
ncbi:hypothetical protein JCM15457_1222 [Liquorilactobacillus sucicola DSM 21376 = JCM 15457]|uniref:DegV family protein n=1 Tax=Liquorilactobacillus sucicola DSM 21376 = JCM 15457 TaxID=1423806 RepID=A0A023CWW2_9LACO|nr:DegV family protein [Liquorilactobacillus sucicola]KRN06822.1 DegV family protein [Liquorilactobacillus sucicola DSM 21376 = JCM 15457]GAJ26299.1 hypothetical protein JCM15457_1222 [Liquorilactobacillus sucicola DSM 21376 = JCM 15457]